MYWFEPLQMVVWCFETFFKCFWGFLRKYKANHDSFGVVRKLDFVAIEWHQNHAITLSGCEDIAQLLENVEKTDIFILIMQ